MAIVKLKLRGNCRDGFHVDLTAQLLNIETEGFLPPLPAQLESSFNNWQLAYRQIDAVRSYIAPSPGMRIIPKAVTKYSSTEYVTSVKECLNEWLNSGDSRWLPVRDRLIAIAQQINYTDEEVRFIIDAKDVNLRRLPWQEWNLFEEYYPQVEISLDAAKSSFRKTNDVFPKSSKIRVLVVVGRSDGINTKDDLEVIKELEQHGAEVICLMQPNRKELCNALWDEQGYHIFIFTGHSGSQEDGCIGWIELNDRDSLNIEEFKEALKQAIDRGLQLAIFNSCDGLGLANQLAQLYLPRCIVMREPVPDIVAVEFLKYFFAEFTRNQSVSKALNKARKRLEHFNFDYPGAIWLPTICVASNIKSLTWESLNSGNVTSQIDEAPDNLTSNQANQKPNIKLKPLILTGLAVGGIAILAWNIFLKPTQPQTFVDSPDKSTQTTFSSITVPSGIFRYGGSTTWDPLRQIVEPEILATHPNFKLINQGAIGSEASIEKLLDDKLENGNLDFALSSRDLEQSETQSKQDNFKLKQIPVAMDGIAIAVNPKLQIAGLTIENLKDIYTGKVTNWKQVGGADLLIVPYSRNPNRGGTPKFFADEVLKNEGFGKNIQFKIETSEALRMVEDNLGGIYYASAPEIVPQCRVRTLPIGQTSDNFVSLYKKPFISPEKCEEDKKLNQINQVNIGELTSNYPRHLTRKLYVIYKHTDSRHQEPDLQQESNAEKAGKAYANLLKTDEAKELMKKAGFAPI
ncbi:substrate-binding domain-containing protein [Rivularia sp. UHCC 0363]|uniref:substrate-binding domain-containing protein n=1 Tax=Rivularia sp. UHCC 0363 TaxID=3110244 RepID=UPI002B2034D3|nr:substrate-binding domain-containing protein [Rivularia sp. UHCC 0363]MEA5596926.1 substrate-binding domain-containing protein [Rivularia sp. UHCC 0363]